MNNLPPVTRAHALWLLIVPACLILASCGTMTAAETAGVAVTGAGALVGFIEALSPMLSPEQQAQLSVVAGNVQTVVEASTAAVGQMAQAIAELKAEQQAAASGEWTPTEQGSLATGVGVAAVAASRVLSRMKHGPSTPAPAT